MRILFLCDDRSGSREAIIKAIQEEIDVVGVVCRAPQKDIIDLCRKYSISLYNEVDIETWISAGEKPLFDYAISYLSSIIIKTDFINYADNNVINFHPAPVQLHKGVAACCYCLLHGYKKWGVTAHYVVPEIDAGDIIKQRFFDVDANITAFELEQRQQKELLELFSDVMYMLKNYKHIDVIKQQKNDIYYSKKQLMQDKNVSLDDNKEEIDKKIKALWFPPFHGASIEIDGKRYSLINDEILEEISRLYKNNED